MSAPQQPYDALAERVSRLEDAEAARNLLHRYAAVLDDPTPEAVAALFTPAGVLSVPAGDFTGREEIAGFYRTRVGPGWAEKRHFITNIHTRSLGGGVVEIASYFLFTSREDAASGFGWGTYDDVIEVHGEDARFVHKTITPHVFTDLDRGWPAGL